jgi:hypothetical protein
MTQATQAMHPLAAAHVPPFITPPGQTDTLLVIMAFVLVGLIVGLGILYFRLHALPEQMMHGKGSRTQFEVVAVLALLALFTHTTAFWIAALLLALVPIPDIATPLYTMAGSLKKMAFGAPAAQDSGPVADIPDQPATPVPVAETGA